MAIEATHDVFGCQIKIRIKYGFGSQTPIPILWGGGATGSAADSRSEGWGFKSLPPQFFYFDSGDFYPSSSLSIDKSNQIYHLRVNTLASILRSIDVR